VLLTGVEVQSEKYSVGMPSALPTWFRPLPFLYESTGVETQFTNRFDPVPRSRRVFNPPLDPKGLWDAQFKAVTNLEHSLKQDRPRALIQMATGSGKTFTAVTASYRLIKHADAKRTLFLVDRANLGRQALKEFQHYATPDDGRKFTELYNVQHLLSNKVDPVARVTISTIQLLSLLGVNRTCDAGHGRADPPVARRLPHAERG
jgi:type I restriction enzyme, R subunit